MQDVGKKASGFLVATTKRRGVHSLCDINSMSTGHINPTYLLVTKLFS
jgi:hypothetical protein